MNNIEVCVLNPETVCESEKMMVAAARLTQHGHEISNMEDLLKLIQKPYRNATAWEMGHLPHPTIQKFGAIHVAIVGISRRFLGQITRHQNEVKFMSSSLQYSDYSGKAQFVVPYEVMEADFKCVVNDYHARLYLERCMQALNGYERDAKIYGHDAASYQLPQGLRGALIISATPYQFKHMIRQRTCNRNSLETQYVMLKVWEELYPLSSIFADCGPACMNGYAPGKCPEGKFSCGEYPNYKTPEEFLDARFKLIRRKKHDK